MHEEFRNIIIFRALKMEIHLIQLKDFTCEKPHLLFNCSKLYWKVGHNMWMCNKNYNSCGRPAKGNNQI